MRQIGVRSLGREEEIHIRVFLVISGTKPLKPLEFFKWREQSIFCYVNEATFRRENIWKWGLVDSGANQVFRGLELSVLSHSLWEGEEGGLEVESITSGQLFTQMLPVFWRLHKTQKNTFQWALQLLKTWKCGQSGTLGGGVEVWCFFSVWCPGFLFNLLVPEFYPFIVNWWSSQ